MENAQGFFILTCNDISKVNQWVQSRCLTIEFKPIDRESMMKCLEYICGVEGLYITASQLGLICDAHEGDLRNAINCLQAYSCFTSPIQANQFLLSLISIDLDCNSFLKVCMDEKDAVIAIPMLQDQDTRGAVRSVFDYGITGAPLSQQKKLQVVDAAITAERDVLSGVDEDIVKANFVRMLMV
jgi:hypothetical protein